MSEVNTEVKQLVEDLIKKVDEILERLDNETSR